MISKKDILNMVRNVAHRSNGGAEKKTLHPRREWFVGICLFTVISVAGGILDARNFTEYDGLESTIENTTPPITTYNASTAANAKEIYLKRTASFEALVRVTPEVPVVTQTDEGSEEDTDAGEENIEEESASEPVEETISAGNVVSE